MCELKEESSVERTYCLIRWGESSCTEPRDINQYMAVNCGKEGERIMNDEQGQDEQQGKEMKKC